MVEDETELLNDHDIYVFNFWDNQKQSNTKEAVEYLESRLKHNFSKNGVKGRDKAFKTFDVKRGDENEIQLKVMMKKNSRNSPLDQSARDCQTFGQDIPITLSLESIKR